MSVNLDKLRNIEQHFNQKFLTVLHQINSIPEGETDPEDVDQFNRLSAAYQYWYNELTTDPLSDLAYSSVNDAIGDCHDLLLGRDTQLFTYGGKDLFSEIFQHPGIRTEYLVNQLSTGEDGEEDAQDHLWSALIGMYRLCVILCIYGKMPIVREIIDMILVENPQKAGVNPQNMFSHVFETFKGKRRMRRMVMKLFKRKDNYFEEVLKALQKVLASFGPGVNAKTSADENLARGKQQQLEAFQKILSDTGVTGLSRDVTEAYIDRLSTRQSVDEAKTLPLTATQAQQIETLFYAQGLHSMVTPHMVSNLGTTMSEVMHAFQTGDETKMQDILKKTGANVNFNMDDMKRMQADMESGQGMAAGFDFSDSDEDEDEDEDETLGTAPVAPLTPGLEAKGDGLVAEIKDNNASS